MTYTYRIFDSIDDVDLTAWEYVRSARARSIFMDPRFIAAAETSMKACCRFWYVILYEDPSRPVACACLFAMTVDLADFSDRRLVWIIRHAPQMLSKFAKWKVLICGLPGAPGEKSLALTSIDASPQILSVLDEVICKLAKQAGMDAIAYKEFGKDDFEWVNPLLDLGYRRIPTPATHFFKSSFQDFAHYCAALKKRYRWHINVSRRKLQNSGVQVSVLTDPEEILRVYTPEVHALYCQMAAKAGIKLEVVPIEFFQQLVLQLKGNVDLVTLLKDSKTIAFAWCLHDGSTYHLLYGGLDYQLNRQLDLYFNLVYACLDHALRKRVSKIHLGPAANAFKARIGCHSVPLYGFAKGIGPLMSRIIHYGANLLVAQLPAIAPHDIFKKSGPDPR